MPTVRQWITGESDINTRKTVEKRKATGRSTKKMAKEYRQNKGTKKGFNRY